MSVAVRRSLYGKMSGDGTLTGLLATAPTGYSQSIFHNQAPQGAAFPYVIFSQVSGRPVYAFSTTPAYEENLWAIKAVDRNTTADRAETIAARLSTLLTDGALSISANTQLYLRRVTDIEYPEVTDGVAYAHAGAQFRLVYQAT